MRIEILPLEPDSYRCSSLHGEGNEWVETNCAADLWIEILASLGLDPAAGLGFTVASSFQGDQWTMFTYPREDLRRLYGLEVHELNVWRSLLDHVDEQLSFGHLVSFDADAFNLPDTRGLTYGVAHQKTTICAQMIDRSAREFGYFHNATYAVLEGEDFDRLFADHRQAGSEAPAMPPYTEHILLHNMDPSAATLDTVVDRLAVHLSRRSPGNPVAALTKRLLSDVDWLSSHSMDDFHRYAFGTCRQLGANAQLAAAFVEWLAARDGGGLDRAGDRFRQVSNGAKTLEFVLARAARGRRVDIGQVMAPIEEAWLGALDALNVRYGA